MVNIINIIIIITIYMPICIYSANSHIYILMLYHRKNNKSCPTQTPNQPKSESDE